MSRLARQSLEYFDSQAEAMMFTAVKRMHTLLQIFMFANLSSWMLCALMKHAFTSDTVLVKEHNYGYAATQLHFDSRVLFYPRRRDSHRVTE